MNFSELKSVMPTLIKHKVPVFLHGQQGIGKTQGIVQIAKEQDMQLVVLNLGNCADVGDVLGLLLKQPNGSVDHVAPAWFPRDQMSRGILYLDEFKRAHPDLHQAMFSLILEGRLHTHQLPPGWYVCAASNYDNEKFNQTAVSDAALISRFCHIDFQPTVEEFFGFLEKRHGESSMSEFLRNHPEMLEVKHMVRYDFNQIEPNRRAWEAFVMPLENEGTLGDLAFEIYKGLVGPAAASAFMAFKAKGGRKISGKDVLMQYPKVRTRVLEAVKENGVRFDLLDAAVEEILSFVKGKTLPEKQVENFRAFILDVPKEMGLKILTKLQTVDWLQKQVLLNDTAFTKQFFRDLK